MSPLGSTRRVLTLLAAGVAAAAVLFSGTPAYAAGGPPMPPVAPQTAPDPLADYHPQNSCSTAALPGTLALRALMLGTYGVGRDGGIMRGCSIGDTSEHKEGRAWDWMLDVNDPLESQHAYAVTRWLSDPDAAGVPAGNARRLGIMYMIWNRTIWSSNDAAAGWLPYDGPNPHTDHVHFSLSWDGAMQRTSWWTGTAITQQDVGPCRLFTGELAPAYTGPRYTPCPKTSPRPTNAGSSAGLDFDGDGRPDAVAREANTGRLWLYSGDGNGGTASQRAVGSGWQGMDALIPTRDVSGDGKPDLWARDSQGYLWLYPGDGVGSFTAPRLVGQGWQVIDAIMAAGDVTGDGIPDIWARMKSDGSLRLYPVRPNGTWGAVRVVGVGWNIFDRIISPGDVTGDGLPDIWARRPDGVLMLYPGAAGSAWAGPRVVGIGWDMHDMISGTADVTGDGIPDLFARNRSNWERWLYPTGAAGQPTAQRVVGWGWNVHDIVI